MQRKWIEKYSEWEDVGRNYRVRRLRSGQIRRYGPEIGAYVVTDLTEAREGGEVLDYCTTVVEKATKTVEHGFINHVTKFAKVADHQWRYETKREWDG